MTEVPIWGNGRCFVNALEAHHQGLALYNSVSREENSERHFGGRPIHEIDRTEVRSIVATIHVECLGATGYPSEGGAHLRTDQTETSTRCERLSARAGIV